MKKINLVVLALAAIPFIANAQDEKPVEKEKKETREIIIRQKGDKDIKLKVEINGDNVTVNGKPLSEFNDKNITINKRKMTITDADKVMNWNFSSDGDEWSNFSPGWDMQDGKTAFLGVTTEKTDDGVLIEEVVKASAAEKAGLKKGDIITRVGEEKITSPEVLSDVVGFKKPKDEITITYKRNGKEATAKAVLGKRMSMDMPGRISPRIHSFSFPRTAPLPGMEGLNGDLLELEGDALFHAFPSRKKIGLKIQDIEEGGGVKVINVEDSSASATAGIQKDDVITEINGKKIDNTDDAREELVPDPEKKSYKIKVNRGGKELNFDVKIPKKLKTANL
jgi:serine protease Do